MLTETINCPLCKSTSIEKVKEGPDVYFIACNRCGEFLIARECLIFSDVREKIYSIGYLLSGLSRELYEIGEEKPFFQVKNLDDYLKHYLLPNKDSVEDKAKKFLQRIRERTTYYGQRIEIDYEKDYSLAYAQNIQEFWALLDLLGDSGLTKNDLPTGIGGVILTATGWDLTNKAKLSKNEGEQAFVAVWFDESMNESVRAIEEAIEESGHKSICIKNEHFSERIMDKALSEIRKSRFIVVDLTGDRNSVFFEAGFAFGLGIEAIYVYKITEATKGSTLEFYVKHYKCYGYNNYQELKDTLITAIGARIK
jgi:nucleoside 2-deoxyribosyltransferase